MMAQILVVVKAFSMIFSWWVTKNKETKAARKKLKKEVNNAIKTGDTRKLHRAMSKL